MAHLEIAYLTGDVQRHELSKQQPVSIGNHKTNDISIDEPDVELMHCRISWNKTGYEAVAAGADPIDVNGNLVQRATLKSGDVMRFGSVDVAFKTGDGVDAGEAAQARGEGFGLKPVTGDLPSYLADDAEETVSGETSGRGSKSGRGKPAAARENEDDVMDAVLEDDEVGAEDDYLDEEDSGGAWEGGLDGLATESRVDVPARRSMPERDDGGEGRGDETDEDEAGADEEAGEDAAEDKPESLPDRLREAMRRQQHRPGEEDSLRSPLVLGLGISAAVLVLLGVVFYFIAGRQTTQDAYNVGADLLAEQKYTPAIKAFDEFILLHRKHPLAEQARVQRDLAKVDQQIRGAVPDWSKGLIALRDFVSEHRDEENFAELQEEARVRAAAIAKGAAVAAGKSFNRDLLQTSGEAKTIFSTYQDDAPTTQLFQEITALARRSEATILRNETYRSEMAKLNAALEDKQPMLALATRRDLLTRYPDFGGDTKLAAGLQETLQTERGLVQVASPGRAAATEDRASDLPAPLTLVFHARSQTDQVSVGECVCVLSKDCCYGVDTVTGRPVWRRVVGLDTPFFPLREPSTPSVVLFDTNHRELVRLNQSTGELIWRQPIDEDVSGQPLLHEGQIYLTTRGGRLYKIDLQSGTVSTRLTFSQEVTGAVALSGGNHLVVAGDMEVVYTLTKQPLECVGVSFLSQKPDSIEAPLLSMGPYVLMVENGDTQTGQLRLLDASDPLRIDEIASADVSGRVLDDLVIRGRDLFVPSTSERVTAFTVSDDAGQPPLVLGPSYEVKGQQRSPLYLATGPDRQLWMASSALRKLQLTTEALEADQNEVAVGISSQPLQYTGGMMFNARRRRYTDAVTFTQRNRDDLSSDWQAVLGARIIAWSVAPGDSPSLTCVTEAGHTFRLTPEDWLAGGFYDEAAERLPIADETTDPIYAVGLTGGEAVVATGGDEPVAWTITRLGKRERKFDLEAWLQAAPVAMGERFVFPVAGKLQVSYSAGQPRIQEFALPSDQAENAEWRQVLPVDATNVVALTASGQVLQIRQQTSPRAHLAEVSRIDLGGAIDVEGDVSEGQLVVADAGRRVRVLDAATLDTKAERELDAPISGRVWISGGAVFAVTADGACHCLDPEDGLKSKWAAPVDLAGAALADRPLTRGNLVLLARTDGVVLAIDAATGEVKRQLDVGSVLTSGPIVVGEELFVATLDGSLVRVTQMTAE